MDQNPGIAANLVILVTLVNTVYQAQGRWDLLLTGFSDVFFTLIEPQVFASHSTLFTTYLFHRFLEATCLPFRAVFCPPKIAALLAKQFFVPHCGFRLVYVGVFDDAIARSAI